MVSCSVAMALSIHSSLSPMSAWLKGGVVTGITPIYLCSGGVAHITEVPINSSSVIWSESHRLPQILRQLHAPVAGGVAAAGHLVELADDGLCGVAQRDGVGVIVTTSRMASGSASSLSSSPR